MVLSSKLFFLSLIYSGHVVLGNYIPRYSSISSTVAPNSFVSSNSSTYHPPKASASASAASQRSPFVDTEHPLSLNLTESAIMQVVNHGSNDTKIIIYDFDVQIGETSLDSLSVNISLSAAHETSKLDMELISLDAGEHLLYLIPRLKNGSYLSTLINADVRLLPKSQSRMIKRWNNNENVDKTANGAAFNAIVEWTIDHKEDEKYDNKDYEDEDDDDDEDDNDDDNDYDNEEDDDDEEDDEEDDDDEDDDDEEDGSSWKWDNNSGWKSNKSKKQKHEKSVKIFISESICLVPTSNTPPKILPTPKPASLASSIPPTLVSGPPVQYIVSTPTLPTLTSEASHPENIATRTETIAGQQVTVVQGRYITVSEPHEITLLVGRATTTTEKETLIANTITFNVETVTEQGRTLTLAGATETVTGETMTVAGPPVTFVALTETVTGPGKTFTKFILQQTTKTTVITLATDLVTVTQTELNPVIETVFGSTSTTTENFLVTVVRTRTPTLTETAI